MVVIQFRKDFLHYGLAEENSLGTDTESFAILSYRRHLAVIQIDDLSVAAHQRLLLLLQIFRIDICLSYFLFCHVWMI